MVAYERLEALIRFFTCVGIVLPAVSAQCPAGAAYLELGSPQSFAGVSSSVLSYSADGGPDGNGHVSFVKQENDYLDGGEITLNMASNWAYFDREDWSHNVRK